MGHPLSLSPADRAWKAVALRSRLRDVDAATLRRWFRDLPPTWGYRLVARTLRYRHAPHLAAATWYEDRLIEIQLPDPFRPFSEKVYYRARRKPGKGLHFAWSARIIRFRTRKEILRFLYCHEFYHWYLHEVLGRKGAAETACDRFALAHFRTRHSGVDWTRALPGYRFDVRRPARRPA